MTDEKVPAIEIIKGTLNEINCTINIERVTYDSDRMEHKFFLSKDSKKCAVVLSRGFLDDLNDYTGSKESKYWIGLERYLKRRLSIPMQIAGLIPFSSRIFFEDNKTGRGIPWLKN
jgi:hypothetical protein